MSTDDIRNVSPIQPTNPVGPTGNADKQPVEGPEFRAILERLQEIARSEEAARTKPAEDTLEFLDAMKQVDRDYSSVMDMRRRLEEAYRKHQP